ncbi:MAG: DUF4340 domain-containing protein [Proteobacteria bacterium]|nr:DUF4340 domain-containing protein [Pseudomonadota bacterium]
MKPLINALGVIFLIQSAMVASLYWPDAGLMEVLKSEQLVPFDPYLVDEIHIGDERGSEAVLLKAGDHWILPDLTGLAVGPDLIEKLLQGVIHAKTNWPVASSVAARQRFQLTDYNFQRRLTLIGNGELLGTVYLGSSPGFRKVQARNSTQDAIYTISYNSFDASAIDSDWLDKRILQISAPLSISSDGYSLHKQADQWLTGSGLAPDKRELDALLLALANLQIEGVAVEDMQRTLSIAVPDIQLSVKTEGGDTSYELFTIGEQHYIHCSDHSLFFTMSGYGFDRFATLDVRRLGGEE